MKVTDETRVPEFMAMLKELTTTHLEIGIFSSSGGDILMIANVNEFGVSINVTPKMRGYLSGALGIHLRKDTKTIEIPERSFIRGGYDANVNKMQKQGEKLLEQVINLQLPVDVFFKTLGESIVGMIQEFMTDLKNPPNHPATIANKGSSNPLIDSGRLRQSITYKVVRR